MQSDEYLRLSAACRAMAAQSLNHLPDKLRWSKLAECTANLADGSALTRRKYYAVAKGRRNTVAGIVRLAGKLQYPRRASSAGLG
jgi:hypothetical protein